MSREEYEQRRKARPDVFPAIEGADVSAPRHLVSHSNSQQDPRYEFVAADAGKAISQSRVRVVVTSYRVRLADDDNLALGSKPLVDCLVLAGIIPSDSPIWCKIEHRQEKVEHRAMERTEMTLDNLFTK